MLNYVIKVYDKNGNFYGYFAKHPEEPGLPYYTESINNAIKYKKLGNALSHAAQIMYDTNFECLVVSEII